MTKKKEPDSRLRSAPKPWNLSLSDRRCCRCGKPEVVEQQPTVYLFGYQGEQIYRPIHQECACEMLGWRGKIDEALQVLNELTISVDDKGPCWCEYAVAGRHSTGCEKARELTKGVTWQEGQGL